jgi:hypothetical protein
MAGNVCGIPIGYNIDIASNDTSNGPFIFGILHTMYQKYNLASADALIGQCMQPIHCYAPNGKADKFTINFHSAFEGSGTVNTTMLNNIASSLNVAAIIRHFDLYRSVLEELVNVGRTDLAIDNIKESIIDGCATNGHKITCVPVMEGSDGCIEKFQFLKYSPLLCEDGMYRWSKNLGTIFRSLGSTDRGPLTHTALGMKYKEFLAEPEEFKLARLMNMQVQGLKSEPRHSIIDALVEKFYIHPTKPYYKSYFEECFMGVRNLSQWRVVDDSLMRRYDLSAFELSHLIDCIHLIKMGMFVRCDALTRIFQIDYDL